jgi:hypothetical protein
MLEPLGGQPIGMQGQKSRKGCWLGVIIGLSVIVPIIVGLGIVGGALLMGNKNTEEYECAMSEVKKNNQVRDLLGEPMEAGWLAPGNFSIKNSERNIGFSTSLTGPKGSGTLYVKSFRNPIGSSFQMLLTIDGKDITLHNGTYPCK